jgi:hypothetical protein
MHSAVGQQLLTRGGPKIEKYISKLIEEHIQVPTGNNMVTKAGNLN